MNIFEDITKALDIPFRQFGIDNNIDAVRENMHYETDVETPYLYSFMRLAPVDEADLGVNEFRQGFYQIDINYAEDEGATDLNEMADKLNQVFKTGACFNRGNICLTVTSFDLVITGVSNGWFTGHATINWNTYTNRL